MKLPFISGSYDLGSRPSGVQRTLNMFPIPVEPGNERAGWVLKDAPGLEAWSEAPAGPPDPTVLLLHGDGANGSTTFTDYSGYSRTVTPSGGAVVSTTQSKFGGSSIRFVKATSSRLLVPATPRLLSLYQYDWGIEMWVRREEAFIQTMASSGNSTSQGGWQIRSAVVGFQALSLAFAADGDIDRITSAFNTFALSTWYHVAATRVDGVVSLWLDGALVGTYAMSQSIDPGNIYFGVQADDGTASFVNYFQGYIDEIRILQGDAPYAGAFTPPTSEFSNVDAKVPFAEHPNLSDLQIATHLDGLDGLLKFTDVSPNGYACTVTGSAQVDTAQSKFGGASLLLGVGARISFAITALNLLTTDFTAECWVRITSDAANFCPFCFGTNGNDFYVQMVAGTWHVGQLTGGDLFTVVETVSLDTWTHIAVCKSGGTTRLYRAGTMVGSSATVLSSTTTTTAIIGARPSPSIDTNGNLDEYEFTKFAKYATNFTPATEDFIPRAEWPPSP